MKSQLFVNKFQKGSTENANLGMGNLVGIDTYSKKGVAILAKKSTVIGGFPSEPHFFAVSSLGQYIWTQCGDGSVLYSSDGGTTWTTTSFPTGASTHGNGLIAFQGYMFAFTDDNIYIHNFDPTMGTWVSITSGSPWQTSLQNLTMNPITGLHFPFLYPNSRGFYFGNGWNIGFVGQVGTTVFNPVGTPGTDYYYNPAILALPSLTYTIASIDFLPPTSLAFSAVAYQNPSQGSDLITWDTQSANKFSPPLRIYSNSLVNPNSTASIKQLYNRNQVLYAVSGGNHTIYETNGSSFNLLEDIGLYSNVRKSTGDEIDYPIYYNSYPQAICVVGNKLLTGTATLTNTATYPPNSLPTAGLFPVGIWSIAFAKDGSHTTQCEFILPINETLISAGGTGNFAKITALMPIPQRTSTTQIIAGYAYHDSNIGNSFGVVLIDLFNYINDINYTAIESELFEIGTALVPQVVTNIEINLVKKLLLGQTIDISYRTSLDQPWSILQTYTGDGTKNYYSLTQNPIGATQFIQLRARMATGAGGVNPDYSPQLKTIVLS